MEIDDNRQLNSNSDHNWMVCDILITPLASEPREPRQVWDIKEDTDWVLFRQVIEDKSSAWFDEEWDPGGDQKPVSERMLQGFNQILIESGEEAVGLKWVGKGGGEGVRRDSVVQGKRKIRHQACKAFNRAQKLKKSKGNDNCVPENMCIESIDSVIANHKDVYEEEKQNVKQYYMSQWKKEIDEKLDQFKADVSGRTFWTWVKKKINRGGPIQGIKTREGKKIFKKDEIKQELFEYYSDLVAAREGPLAKQGGYSLPKGQSKERDQRDETIFADIKTKDIKDIISGFKNRKAVALDQIPNEFLKYGGTTVWAMMGIIFNAVLREGKFPQIWKKGRTSFIPKPKSDGTLDTMRGLTINSSVGKVLLKILEKRMTLDVEERGVLGEMQHGFRRGFQTLDALYVLTDTVARRKVKGLRTAAAFIDIKKAYDWVDRDVLWGKLEELGFGIRLISFLQDMYRDTTTRVRFQDIETGEIPVKVGLKQGCCLSPLLFAMYIQEISIDLAKSGEGVWVGPEGGKVKIPALLFADDLVLIADSEGSLQRLLDIVGNGARKLNMTLSPEKSKVLLSWRGPDKRVKWNCGFMKITEGRKVRVKVEMDEDGEYKYLGIYVKFHERIFEKQADTLLIKARKQRGLNTLIWTKSHESIWVAAKLWLQASLPALLYGSEVMILNEKEILKVDRIQRDVARRIVGGHKGCAIKAMYGELGWKDIKYDFDKRLLRFVGRMWVGGLPENRWSVKVFLEGLEDVRLGKTLTPWWTRVSKKFDEYELDTSLLIRKESFAKWKAHVDKQIIEKANSEWRDRMDEMHTLRYYKKKEAPCYEEYLRDDWEKKRELFKLRTGQAMLNSIRCKWDPLVDEVCLLCGEARETEEHLVLECKNLDKERGWVLDEFKGALGREGWEEFQGLPTEDKMGWILGLDKEIRDSMEKVTWKRIFAGIARLLYRRNRVAGYQGKGYVKKCGGK